MNRTGTFHKVMTGLLCIIMVLSMPFTAFAMGENKYYFLDAGDGNTVAEYGVNEDKGITDNPGWTIQGKNNCTLTIPSSITILGVVDATQFVNNRYLNSHVSIVNHGVIAGGIFQGAVTNYGKITGGYFYNTPVNQGPSGSFGGEAKTVKKLTVESKGGTASFGVPSDTDASNFLKNDGRGIAGETYNVQTNNGELIGLYLLSDGDATPQAPYSIDTAKFRKLLGGIAYDFDMPDEDTTVFAVYKGYGGELTIGGAIEQAFNFEKDSTGNKYLFNLVTPPESLQTYEWSVDGTLPEGLSLMNSTTSNAYIGGTPTQITNKPVKYTLSVQATAANGDIYYGTTDILINVYEPENPFEEAEALLKGAECTVQMETANSEETVSQWLNNTWLPGIDGLLDALDGEFDVSMLSVVLDEDFTAATAGSAANPNGTDGSVTFNVEVVDEMPICENLTCKIKATTFNHTHSGGTATYKDRAICEVCGQPYGETTADTTSPTGVITVGTNKWNSFFNTITFNLFFKQTQTVEVTAADTESGVMKIEYYLSDKMLEVFTSVSWTEYTNSFNINQDNDYIIYVKITDKAGNSAIINSDGIVLDQTAPIVSGIEDGKTYCTAVEVSVNEKHLDYVMINGNKATIVNGKFTVNPYTEKQFITATDKAGNSVSYTITVNNWHKWEPTPRVIDYESHGVFCSVCNTVIERSITPHTFYYENGKRVCTFCEYEEETNVGTIATVYNEPDAANATIWLTGSGLNGSDLLITEHNPQGSAYDALRTLTNSDDVFDTYSIYLRSGNKSITNGGALTFELDTDCFGQEFTLIHQKSDGTYEYFYDTADNKGDLTFGPLYELSPFMLVKGTLMPPQESGSENPETGDNNTNLWLWATLLVVSGTAATALGVKHKRRRLVK